MLAVIGFIWGLCKSLETAKPQAMEIPPPQTPRPSPKPDLMRELDRRLARIEADLDSQVLSARPETVARADGSALADGAPAPGNPYVTHEELKELLGGIEKRMESHVAKQFGKQALAIDSLRAMIVDTDMLLERVLSRLDAPESGGDSAEFADHDEPGGHPGAHEDARTLRRESPTGAGKRPVSTSAG